MNWHRYFAALARGDRWAVAALAIWFAALVIALAAAAIIRS